MARPALDRVRLTPAIRSYHGQGFPARSIARRLGISERSTRTILKDLGLTSSRTEVRHAA